MPDGIRRVAITSRVIDPDYYRTGKPAKRIRDQGLTIEDMKEAARIPVRAAGFTFNGTQLHIENNNKTD